MRFSKSTKHKESVMLHKLFIAVAVLFSAFALYAQNDVIPIFFGGNEKIGLRKNDKLLQFHPTERYLYNLKVLPTIPIKEYENMPLTKSATKLTHKMKEILEKEQSI